jgi:hypothetical protein
MNRLMFITAAAVAVAGIVGSANALADEKPIPQETRASCHPLMGHCVLSVTPRWIEQINGKRTRRLAGVDLRIAAEPGMTAEYLTVEAQRAAAAGSLAAGGVFGVEGSRIEVRSTGDGFVFHLTAPDTNRAEELVRRAQRLG